MQLFVYSDSFDLSGLVSLMGKLANVVNSKWLDNYI